MAFVQEVAQPLLRLERAGLVLAPVERVDGETQTLLWVSAVCCPGDGRRPEELLLPADFLGVQSYFVLGVGLDLVVEVALVVWDEVAVPVWAFGPGLGLGGLGGGGAGVRLLGVVVDIGEERRELRGHLDFELGVDGVAAQVVLVHELLQLGLGDLDLARGDGVGRQLEALHCIKLKSAFEKEKSYYLIKFICDERKVEEEADAKTDAQEKEGQEVTCTVPQRGGRRE